MSKPSERSALSRSGVELPLDLNGTLWVSEEEGRGRLELRFGSMGVVALLTLENLQAVRRDLDAVIGEIERKESFRGKSVLE